MYVWLDSLTVGRKSRSTEGTMDDLCDGPKHYLQGVSQDFSFDFVRAGALFSGNDWMKRLTTSQRTTQEEEERSLNR